MPDARSEILRRIRGALAQPLGEGAAQAARPATAHTYAPLADGESLADRFTQRLLAVSGQVQRLAHRDDVLPRLRAFVAERGFRRVAVVRSGLLQSLAIEPSLHEDGVEVRSDADWQEAEQAAAWREWLSAADLCISGVDYALAETGSIVVQARPGQPRSATLLPPVHLAVVGEEQIEPALETLLPKLKMAWNGSVPPGSALTLITGPSRSADIEQTLTLGVHGPVEVLAMLVPQG